jgi:ribonuclease HI
MQFIGIRTNNFAEYTALLQGLKTCLKYSYEYVDAYLDSELIVKQLKGEYRVKNPDLTPLYKEVESLKKEFRSFTVTHIPRSQNSKADSLANIAIKNCIRDLDVKFSKTLVNIL